MANLDWRKLLKECLDSANIGSLATLDSDGVWACSLFFVYDNDFNLYFMSENGTRHMANLRENPRVAVSIYDPKKVMVNVQVGIEIIGVASEVPEEMLDELYRERQKRYGGSQVVGGGKTAAEFLKEHNATFVMVKPVDMWYTNTELFDGKNVKVPIVNP